MIALEKRRFGISLVHDHGPHLRGVEAGFEFGGQALVEGEGRGFGGGVVDHVGDCHVGCVAGDGDDHAVVVRDEGGEEFFGHEEVR